MKIIPTFVHGVTDYLGAIVLFFLPTLFGFAYLGGAAVWVPRLIAILVLVQALSTDYELGVFRLMSMRPDVKYGMATAARCEGRGRNRGTTGLRFSTA